MRSVADLIENQQNIMSEMHKDFMSLMREYMNTAETQEEEHHEKVVVKEDRDQEEAIAEEEEKLEKLDEERLEQSYEENLDLPRLEASVDGDIDIDDPAYSYGVARGIPMSVYLDYHPRGPLGLLDIKNGYFVER